MDTFPARLKAYMQEHGLTQKQVGDMTGIAQTTISAYLNSVKAPTLDTLRALSQGLGVTVGWLCGDPEASNFDWTNGTQMLTFLHGLIDSDARRWGFSVSVKAGEEGPISCFKTDDTLIGGFFIEVLQARRLYDDGALTREMYDAIIDRLISKYSAADFRPGGQKE